MNEEIWTSWDWSGDGEESGPPQRPGSSPWSLASWRSTYQKESTFSIGPGAGRWTEALLRRANHLTGVDIL